MTYGTYIRLASLKKLFMHEHKWNFIKLDNDLKFFDSLLLAFNFLRIWNLVLSLDPKLSLSLYFG